MVRVDHGIRLSQLTYVGRYLKLSSGHASLRRGLAKARQSGSSRDARYGMCAPAARIHRVDTAHTASGSMGNVAILRRREQLTVILMLVALGVTAWKAALGDWIAVLIAMTTLAPAGLLWQLQHFVPKPCRRTGLRLTLALTAVFLVVLAVVAR